MASKKLYTTKEIAEMLQTNRRRVANVVYRYRIKPVKSIVTGKCNSKTGVFNIAAVNKIRRILLKIEKEKAVQVSQRKIRPEPQPSKNKRFENRSYLPKKSNAVSDAALGMHDAEATELLQAVDRYKRENQLRYGMRVSDYLAVFKSMPKPWIKNLLSQS